MIQQWAERDGTKQPTTTRINGPIPRCLSKQGRSHRHPTGRAGAGRHEEPTLRVGNVYVCKILRSWLAPSDLIETPADPGPSLARGVRVRVCVCACVRVSDTVSDEGR